MEHVEEDDSIDVFPVVAEASLSQQEALDVLQAVRTEGVGDEGGGGAAAALTALELLQQEEDTRSIITFSSQLDTALGGGLPVGKTTEICGAPGVGKTQLWSETQILTHVYLYISGVWDENIGDGDLTRFQ